jgi:uncharacterized RDD family membrane protein YckC
MQPRLDMRDFCADYIVVVVVISVALLAASTAQSDNFSRAIGISVLIAWLLYEPVLVSLAGSTLGHYFVNLRVVDNRHGGNVSFLKAVVRFVIKTVLGWFSFIVMTATRRNQALHDLIHGADPQSEYLPEPITSSANAQNS